ncbi:kinase-like domain-containing protein [Ilyonectria robusta]|uniref:kinase-like domain-containing protein n=1 Tax=Ilyonectria robusta TaxID=1079257 RepID=UPI001E8D1FC7|nr:kinase-like domain-containing protein [Ilyonectria robusta]KAH8737291.1 kinase-like domain-containing protein [Ilyonectria robusta]
MHGVINQTNRSAAADEDVDHIGFETPRSGVATPQPDLQDKRLPGIMSYFGQVRQNPPTANISSQVPGHPESAMPPDKARGESTPPTDLQSQAHTENSPQDCLSLTSDLLLLHREHIGLEPGAEQMEQTIPDPYPTPPISQPSSSGCSLSKVMISAGADSNVAAPAKSLTLPSRPKTSGTSLFTTTHFQPDDSSPPESDPSTCTTLPEVSNPSSPHEAPSESSVPTRPTPGKWYSLDGLKELTRAMTFKSGPPTPTRALSAARPSGSDGRINSARTSNDGAEVSGTQTPRSTGGAQAPAPKGKMTIKITEARGLRKSRDPYVVVVFQRSELISSGPRNVEGGHSLSVATPGKGGIAIQRQGSDSGRPMAIPMRSRQSSNTSVTDYNTFRNRSPRESFTSPKWDAEAAFDVVDSNMLVDISVYDHATTGDEFLGHVDFKAVADPNNPVKGWFQLEGHADTMAENAPTGEIYVEALYQRSERKHFGPTDFDILKLIGKGTFGQVYQVRKKDTQRIYAMKVLQKKVIVQKKEVAHTVGERNILVRTAMSDSPFIVGLKFSFQTPSELYLVTDYMSGGELFWHLQKEGRFDEKRAKFYIAELILAIQHLHHSDIVYRDLKPENILLDANGHIALCDFGLSKANLTKNDTTNTFCGTTEYLAPEVLLDESGYTKMVDFWSLGVLVFEMCCGWSPFYAEDTQQMYKNIAFGKVRFPRDTLSQEGRNFVKGLLNRNPKHRLGATDDAEELKRHAFFADIDWTLLSKKLITPPFKPKLKSETDVSYFDPEFTTALDQNGSLNERAAALARGYAASTPLSPSVQANFQGFTFVDESALDDHFRDRHRIMDDEDMDDAHHDDNDDWDNLDDIDLRKANRMSGIVRSSTHDEQMVGGSHFDV